MSYYQDKIEEERKDNLKSVGIVIAISVWFFLMLALSSLIQNWALRFPSVFQRNIVLRNEQMMLENEIKYKFATDTGIKVKMEGK